MARAPDKKLVVPERYRRTPFAQIVLDGRPRRELLEMQTVLRSTGTGLRLDHRTALSLLVDLRDSGWRVGPASGHSDLLLLPPGDVSRERQRRVLRRWKTKNPHEEPAWLEARAPAMLKELASGSQLSDDRITPVLHPCITERQHELFRFLNASWSAPQGRYIGRRLRFIVRDHGQPRCPVIGIVSLGSSIVRCKERDEYIGWSPETRRGRLINIMDVTVLGALPPYSFLLGGKLMCYIAASDQVRHYYMKRYSGRTTEQLGRRSNDLALLVTSSLYGRSSLYNRVRYNGEELYEPIGTTSGFGTLHLSGPTIMLMKELLERRNATPANRFGDGPNWKMRLVRTACDVLGFDHKTVLNHGLKKSLFAVRTARNSLEHLRGGTGELEYFGRPMKQLVEYWKTRWLAGRAARPEVKELVISFDPMKWQGWR